MSISTIPGMDKRVSESGEMVKCAVGKKHCCTVNTETLILEKWYPICSVDCIGAMVLRIMNPKTKITDSDYLEFKL